MEKRRGGRQAPPYPGPNRLGSWLAEACTGLQLDFLDRLRRVISHCPPTSQRCPQVALQAPQPHFH